MNITETEVYVALNTEEEKEHNQLLKEYFLNHITSKPIGDTLKKMIKLCTNSLAVEGALIEKLNAVIRKGEKAVVFTHFNQRVTDLAEVLQAELPSASVYVATKMFGHEGLIRSLENFDKFKGSGILVCTDAVATGYSIDCANHLFHLDYCTDPQTIFQRNHRILRITNPHNEAFITYFVVSGTVHEVQYNQVKEKMNYIR